MFLTCLINSKPPAFKRSSFGVLFHCFAAKYLKEFKPCFVVFTKRIGNYKRQVNILVLKSGCKKVEMYDL